MNKASESLRYLTLRQEEHKAKDTGELKDELKGKRVWRVGGVGMWSYSLDEREEEGKRELWRDWGARHGKNEWINAAKERTEFYEKGEHAGSDFRLISRIGPWALADTLSKIHAESSRCSGGSWSTETVTCRMTPSPLGTRTMAKSSTPPGRGGSMVSISASESTFSL